MTMNLIDMFRFDAPDSFEGYDVLPKPVANPMTAENFNTMEETGVEANTQIDTILEG